MEKELYYRSLRFKFYKINPYLDSHLSRYIVVKIFVTPGDFFHHLNLKIGQSRFLLAISNEHGLTLWIRYSGSDSKFWSPIMCSDTKHLDILIVLYICSYIMSYDNSNSNLGDTDTIVSCNQSREIHYDLSLGKFDFWLNYSSDILYIVFHSESLRIIW